MLKKLAMATAILALTVVLLEVIGSRHNRLQPEDPDQSQIVAREDRPKTEEVEITIKKIVEPPPQPPPRAVQPRPEKPKAVEPISPPALAGRTFTPSALDYLKGDRLLEGGFPRLHATYERLGFPAYRDAVLALGGEFFVWDGSENQPIAHLDTRTGATSEASIPSDLSRWPRDVTMHLEPARERSKEEFGERASHVVLLPPTRLDAALLSGLNHLLEQNDVDPASVSGFFGAYELRGRRLYCVVLSTSFKDGTERPVSFSIDLGGAFL